MRRLVCPALLASALTLGALNAMAIEEAPYNVTLQQDKFEIRDYAPAILAEVTVQADLEQAGNIAFNQLFRYISGANQGQQKIAMTAPVSQEPAAAQIQVSTLPQDASATGVWQVGFMMPASFTLDTLPAPEDAGVTLRQIPARRMAAVRYSGRWTAENYRQYLQELQTWTQQQGLTPAGPPVWARYNPPFMPPFLRRNEILIPVQPPAAPE